MPGNVGILVNGQYVVIPGVYPIIDASQMVPVRPGPGGIVGCAGACDGGIPGVIYNFTRFSDAQAVLRGGPALSYLARIFGPSPDVPGASSVLFTRVGSPTQGTVALAGMTFTSIDYGRHVNGIAISIVAGSVSGTWDVKVVKASDGYTRTHTVGLALSASSTATTPKVVFDHAQKECRLYENAVVVATLPYPTDNVTVANLVAFIQGRAGWNATITGDGSMPLRFMDNPVLGSAPTILTTMTPLPASQGQLQWVLSQQSTQVTAVLTTGTTFGALSAVGSTPLAGGTGSGFDSMSSSDFGDALDLFASADIQHLFLCTSDSASQQLALAHVTAMNQITTRRYRIFYTGGAPNETAANAVIAAQSLPGAVVYAWNGTVTTNPVTGLQEQLGGIGAAAQLCGASAGTPEATPITNKTLFSQGLEVANVIDSDKEACIKGGVTAIFKDPVNNQATILQAITTYQGGPNPSFRKLQGLRIQQAIARLFMVTQASMPGGKIDLINGQMFKNRCAAALDKVTVSAKNPDGIITPGFVNGQQTPAYQNLEVTTDGTDTWFATVEAHPVGEADFVVVTVKLTPVQITI